jgi:hypothetical protein
MRQEIYAEVIEGNACCPKCKSELYGFDSVGNIAYLYCVECEDAMYDPDSLEAIGEYREA